MAVRHVVAGLVTIGLWRRLTRIDRDPDLMDFILFLALSMVTFGVYTLWWNYIRLETLYRGHRGFGDFIVFLLLGVVTAGIYTVWWLYTRLEMVYRDIRRLNQEGQIEVHPHQKRIAK